MSRLMEMYDEQRADGLSHNGAIRRLARLIALDQDTLRRQLTRSHPERFPKSAVKEPTR